MTPQAKPTQGFPRPPGSPPIEQANGHARLPAPLSEAGRAVTEAVYWQSYYEHSDFNYEWNNGILEEKPVADVRNAKLYRWFLILLNAYLEVQRIAQLVNLEIGFRLALPDKTTIRKPDLFVVRHDNPTPLRLLDRTFAGICDLCVESLSDATEGEIKRDTEVKKTEYEGIGVREYYILDVSGVHMVFYYRTPDGDYVPLDAEDGVIRSRVLPGFQFRLADLYRQPSLIELSEDVVYRDFVLPQYQAEKARAERERGRAEQAEVRAEQAEVRAEQAEIQATQERARAERLAAQLRALGINPE